VLEGLEQCDDGNTDPNDGCHATCGEEYCGDGVTQTGEGCDDGNLTAGDGCDPLCQPESVCPVVLTGDVNQSGSLTSSDIIALVNFVFKGGPAPLPCAAAGDVNCSGGNTSSDIIALVNHVFKGGAAPCNVCTLVPGTWSCP
jgi:cysteine-rich repeat protein